MIATGLQLLPLPQTNGIQSKYQLQNINFGYPWAFTWWDGGRLIGTQSLCVPPFET